MRREMKISADGFMDLSDRRRVRTPGTRDAGVEPMPEAEALSFLLLHSFPGHRRVIRPMTESDRKNIRLAVYSGSVQVRMAYVDRVWRNITEPVLPPLDPTQPELIQVIHYGGVWAYPVYLDGDVTRVIPHGGLPMPEVDGIRPVEYSELNLKIA
ncbi:MAG: hypothetical protein EXR95_10705 [Gemmatimonadetes bacterium]|nr:hypothetical protein [Gemmatimonadota bacterium]